MSARIEPITGRYVHLDIEGRPYRIYFEEAGSGSQFYVAAIAAFSQAMQLERPVVMGCSMGGRVVVRLAQEQGKALRGVIGLEGSDSPSPWYDNSWLESPEFLRGDFCAALVSGLVAPQSPDEFRWETLWHYYQGSDYARESSTIDTGHCPVYLMTGEYDYSCTPEDTLRTAERIPGAEAIIMAGMGHFPMSENPAAFREHFLPVLAKIADKD